MANPLKKNWTITNIILLFVIVICGVIAFSLFNKNEELETEISTLETELKSEQEYNEIYKLTREFIELSNVGKQLPLLTGKAKLSFESAIEQEEVHKHVEDIVEKIDVMNVYASKTGENLGESYAIYRVFYNTNSENDTNIAQQQILTLSLQAKWEKTKDGYKVYEYKIDLLKDSLDEYIKKLIEKEKGDTNESE